MRGQTNVAEIRASRETSRPTRSTPRRPVHSPDELHFLLSRERSRAERLGHEFALVIFEDAHGWIDPPSGAQLAKLLATRLRITDDFGWHDDRRMCAILPGTHAEGAHRFAERIGAVLADEGMHLTRTIYIYPSRWFGGPPSDHDPHHDNDSPGGDGNGYDPAAARARLEAAIARSARSAESHARVESMEARFTRPLPGWKRSLDILGAAVMLAATSPLFLIAAAAVKFTSKGPVVFTQERAGLGGRPFRMYKFRTMIAGAEQQQDILRPLSEQDGPAFKLRNDPRITPVGAILRKTSIDELPQLVNVLRGDMSLVGPRPLPCRESDGCQQWHRARLDVIPGLTCIWQVNGRSNTDFDRWVRMDLEYIRKQSPWYDLKLIARTIPAVLLQRGAK